MSIFILWLISIIAIGSVLWMLWARNIVHSVIALTVFFVAVAILFAQLGAHILAIGQILIFVGGIVVLMLLAIGAAGFEESQDGREIRNRKMDARYESRDRRKIGRLGGYVVRPGYAMMIGGFFIFLILPFALTAFLPIIGNYDAKEIARVFFNEYGILVALGGLIIFTSLVSAVYFLKKDID